MCEVPVHWQLKLFSTPNKCHLCYECNITKDTHSIYSNNLSSRVITDLVDIESMDVKLEHVLIHFM